MIAWMGAVGTYTLPYLTLGRSPIFGSEDYIRYHGFYYHAAMAWFVMLYYVLRPAKATKHSAFFSAIIVSLFVVLALVMSIVISTNFMTFHRLDFWPFDVLALRSRGLSQAVLFTILITLTFAVATAVLLIDKLFLHMRTRLTAKRQSETE